MDKTGTERWEAKLSDIRMQRKKLYANTIEELSSKGLLHAQPYILERLYEGAVGIFASVLEHYWTITENALKRVNDSDYDRDFDLAKKSIRQIIDVEKDVITSEICQEMKTRSIAVGIDYLQQEKSKMGISLAVHETKYLEALENYNVYRTGKNRIASEEFEKNPYESEMRKKTDAELNILIREWMPSHQLHIAAEVEISKRRRFWKMLKIAIAVGGLILTAIGIILKVKGIK